MRYTTIIHDARLELGLTMNDYCIADCIYHYANNPKNPTPGWCYASKRKIGEQIGISKEWVIKSIKHLEDKGYVEKSSDGRLLRTTEAWYFAVIESFPIGEHRSPLSVNRVHRTGEQSSPPTDNKSDNKSDNTSGSKEPDPINAYNDSADKFNKGMSEVVKAIDLKNEKKGKKKKEVDECYPGFVEAWCKVYPVLGFDALSGVKIKSMIAKLRTHVIGKGEVPTKENTTGMFQYILTYVKRENHWVHGKPIGTFEQHLLSIVFEIANGRQHRSKAPTVSIFSKYHPNNL